MASDWALGFDAIFLTGGGEMGAMMREHDWSTSPLGPPESWPQSLRSVVGLMLNSRFPMFAAWGEGLGFVYNDAYVEILGEKHPSALGRRFRDIWSEIWSDISPLIDSAMAGDATYRENLPLTMNRKGYDEQTWFTFSYSPVQDESGAVAGMFCACTETTEAVRAQRRQTLRIELEDRLSDLADPGAVMDAAAALLGRRLGANRVGYGEVQADEVTVVLHSCYVDGVAPLEGPFPLDGFGPAMIARQRQGLTQSSPDVTRDPDMDPAVWAAIDTSAFVSVPLVRDGRFAASLYVNVREPHAWAADEIVLIEETAARTWSAVERARAETALRRGEALLSAVLDALPVGVILADAQGRVTRTNAANGELWGVPPETIGFEQYGEWVGWWPATGERIAGTDWAMARALLHGETVKNELFENQRFGTGERRFILNNAAPVRDASGAIVAGVVAQMDVTERLAAEQSLKQLTETLEARVVERTAERDRLWQSSQDLLMVARFDGTVVTVNPAWATALGWSEAEMIGTQFWTLIHPGDVAACQVHAIALSTGGQTSARFECRYRAKSGDWHWLAWSATSGAGLFNGVARDVTDEKVRAAELARRTAERDQVWKTSRGLLMIADLEGVLRAANPAWTRTLGYTEAETVGRSFRDFIVGDDIYPTEEALATAASGADLDGFKNRYRHKDGSIRHLAWHTSAEDGLIYAFGRDITDERAREAEVRALEEHLRQSQKMEAMGQLTGGVAHDFNNLLTPIIGGLDMLMRRGVGSERERRLIDGALQSAERAKLLVQRLLSFARRQPLQPVAVEISSLMEGLVGLIGSTLGPTIDLRVNIDPDLPPAKADQNQLEMALLNLAVNARDAMPEGGELTIRGVRESVRGGHASGLEAGDYVLLCVVDTGAGMDGATRQRAIEPFFSTKGVGKGTGLGLSMVHGLAAQLGGGLTIDSTPGIGTTIELWLPISTAAIDVEGASTAALATPVGRGVALLVDDEELVRMSTADMLIDLGFEVIEAGTAEQALQILKTGAMPNLLITDHLMPGMTGVDLARKARAIEPTLPILIVSGYAEVDGVAQDLPRLTKPFRIAELAESLSALL